MKNPFRIRAKVVEMPGDWLIPPYYIIEYRKWWQFKFHPLMECVHYPYIFHTRESAEKAVIETTLYLM